MATFGATRTNTSLVPRARAPSGEKWSGGYTRTNTLGNRAFDTVEQLTLPLKAGMFLLTSFRKKFEHTNWKLLPMFKLLIKTSVNTTGSVYVAFTLPFVFSSSPAGSHS